MNPHVLAAGLLALPVLLGAKLAAILVLALAVLAAGIHLLPLIAVLGIPGTALLLAARVITVIWQTGPGIVPARKARAAW